MAYLNVFNSLYNQLPLPCQYQLDKFAGFWGDGGWEGWVYLYLSSFHCVRFHLTTSFSVRPLLLLMVAGMGPDKSLRAGRGLVCLVHCCSSGAVNSAWHTVTA